MASVALIACSKAKSHRPDIPCLFYLGTRFQLALDVACKRLCTDRVFAISSKHGLIPLYESIEPYDESLVDKTVEERWEWARGVADELPRHMRDITRIIVLAEDLYANPLRAYLPYAEYPLANMSEEEQKAWLASC